MLFNPAVDTSRDSPGLTDRFGKRGREASPAQHVMPGLPPIPFLLHGKADATVPFADVERFCAAATERGNQCRLVGYEGAAHGFFNPPRSLKDSGTARLCWKPIASSPGSAT